jgi:hypothetical protein
VDLDGSPVDLGGSWIHMPVGNPMRTFADRAGVACRPANPLPELAGFDLAEQRRLSTAEVEDSLRMQYTDFPAAVERLRVELGPDASMADAIAVYLAKAALPPADERRAHQALHAIIEAESAGLAADQSLRWMWNEYEYDGDFFGDVPVGGYRELVDAMAADVDVRLGAEVAEVLWAPVGVAVRLRDGTVETGSHAVITVPLGVLKRSSLKHSNVKWRGPTFTPALPPDRRAAIDRLGFGRFEKVVLRFDEPFWRAAGVPHLMIFPRDPAKTTVWALGLDAFGAGPALVCFVFHAAAERVLSGTADDAVAWVLGMVAEVIGRPCPAPIAAAVTSWGTDPYAGGAYTHIPPGASPADADLLAEPVGGRLLFAGEHTQSARLAYADGAMTSGIRAAKRLLGRSSVRLGRIN